MLVYHTLSNALKPKMTEKSENRENAGEGRAPSRPFSCGAWGHAPVGNGRDKARSILEHVSDR